MADKVIPISSPASTLQMVLPFFSKPRSPNRPAWCCSPSPLRVRLATPGAARREANHACRRKLLLLCLSHHHPSCDLRRLILTRKPVAIPDERRRVVQPGWAESQSPGQLNQSHQATDDSPELSSCRGFCLPDSPDTWKLPPAPTTPAGSHRHAKPALLLLSRDPWVWRFLDSIGAIVKCSFYHSSLLRSYLAGKVARQPVWAGTWARDRTGAEMLRRDLEAADIPYAVEGPDGPLFADFHARRHSYLTLGGRPGRASRD
jgi:hypothetical protein